jgi:hypothetical protein
MLWKALESLLIGAVRGIGSSSSAEAVKVSCGCVEHRGAAHVSEVGVGILCVCGGVHW